MLPPPGGIASVSSVNNKMVSAFHGGTRSNKISPDKFSEVKLNYESMYLIILGVETLSNYSLDKCSLRSALLYSMIDVFH